MVAAMVIHVKPDVASVLRVVVVGCCSANNTSPELANACGGASGDDTTSGRSSSSFDSVTNLSPAFFGPMSVAEVVGVVVEVAVEVG